jgi:type II secretory pathway pseudopilin PulG
MKLPVHFHSFTHPRNMRGFTLTELAIMLGIVGILLAAIWVAGNSVHRGNQANQAAQELQTISQNMLTLYQNRALPAVIAGCPALPDITANAIAAEIVPSGNVVPGAGGACASASNPWSGAGGSLKIISIPATKRFGVKFFKVPLDGCIALLLHGTGCDPSQAGCPARAIVTAGATVTTETPAVAPPSWSGVTPATATTDCGSGAVATDTVEFDFQL